VTKKKRRFNSFGEQRQEELMEEIEEHGEIRIPVDYETLRERAEATLSDHGFTQVAGSAGNEDTKRENREAFRRWRIVPRMLRNIDDRDMSIELFGQHFPAPLLLAPIGVQSMIHEEGALASARAARELNIPFTLSTASTPSIEEVADALGDTPRWFQLYPSSNHDITRSLIERAEAAGYSAIVYTVDGPPLGWRERDLNLGYLPNVSEEGIGNFLSDPAFRNGLEQPPEEDMGAAVDHYLDIYAEDQMTWEDLEYIQETTNLPLLLKGILHPDDARKALGHGIDGLVVSNHGGRQVDGAIAALDALEQILEVIDSEIPVLFDSGIRRGADAFKALAIGADAVMLGRPYIYGLALEGQCGVEDVIKNFLADLDLTMALSGHASFDDVDRSDLFRRE
jgi:isopentenyl diphosphate isomerase/L-lactate dehydrogenase-like FMN-dependent dehydrogenase